MKENVTVRDIFIDSMLIALTVYSVFTALDQATDGRFRIECQTRILKATSSLRKQYNAFDTARRERGKVIWDAWGAVGRDETNNGDNERDSKGH